MDIVFLLVLILLNGAFAMSEMAVVSSRKTRLMQWVDEGRAGAKVALTLSNDPSHFLSTIQVGITAIGILSGIIGEAAFAKPLARWLSQFAVLEPYATGVSVAVVVVSVTAMSLIFGELVPKRFALRHPEAIASAIARPMGWLSIAAYPLVRVLSFITESIVALFGATRSSDPPVTEEEIHVLMEQGRAAGVFDPHEQDIVRRAFALDDVRVSAVMTPRHDLVVMRTADDMGSLKRTIEKHGHTRYPVVVDGGEIVGLIRTKVMVDKLLSGAAVDPASLMEKALFVPRSLTLMRLLELFKKFRQQAAIVVDEYGHTHGMVTLNDVLAALVGDIGEVEHDDDPAVMRRADGSWLVSGSLGIESFKEATLAELALPEEDQDSYNTMSGLAMTVLQRVPKTGDRFETEEFAFEVVDMDHHRVDKLLVSRKTSTRDEGSSLGPLSG